MRRFMNLKNFLSYGLIVGFLAIGSCTEEENPDPNPVNDTAGLDFNKLTNRVIIENISKISGTIPSVSNMIDVKIHKDTIFIVEGIKNRIRILYPSGSGSVSGSSSFYFQVEGADEYLDIKPVVEESDDTIGVFYMGFDPGDLDLPFSFNIKFAPHDDTGTAPIDVIGKVVLIEKKGDFSCSPERPEPKWDWIYTISDGDIETAPGFGRKTETHVTGCCDKKGESVDCLEGFIPESEWISLEGNSAYKINYEILHFSSNENMVGTLEEFIQNLDPSPVNSNFCSGNLAYIINTNDHAFWGNYTYDPSNGKYNLPIWKAVRRKLILKI